MQKYVWLIAMLFCAQASDAQTDLSENNSKLDSLYIDIVENNAGPLKVLHAEPLYIDLIRDLGARKGEHEWNLGMGITDNLKYDTYQVLVEYEFAPIDRLGLEIELPFTFHAPLSGTDRSELPSHRMESLKTACQYTLLVSGAANTSMAIGYINELVFEDLKTISKRNLLKGNVFNPFFVAAKRWGNNFHTLVYTGPRMEKEFAQDHLQTHFDINTNLHYMIPGTRNFVGLEMNKTISHGDLDMTLRPQLRLGVTDNVMLGIVGGIPVKRENERFSCFMRLIWEPGNHH